jgi:predicted phosphoribosyltransferase
LNATIDIIIPRKLTDIDNKEQAISAVMEAGTIYIDETIKFHALAKNTLKKRKHIEYKK